MRKLGNFPTNVETPARGGVASPRAVVSGSHAVGTLVGQRVMAIALGYEDIKDHDRLRDDGLLDGGWP